MKRKGASELKVKPPPPPTGKQKMNFHLPGPTAGKFNLYLAAYQELYGTEPDPNFILDQILTSFFESDKAFLAYQKKTHAQLGGAVPLGEAHL